MNYNIEKLPKWAQKYIEGLQIKLDLASEITKNYEQLIKENENKPDLIPTFEECEVLAMETDYAVLAVEPEGNEINGADASAFFLEGCRHMYNLLSNGD